MKLTIEDSLQTIGIAIAAYGLWQIYPPLTFLAVGGFLFYLGLPRR